MDSRAIGRLATVAAQRKVIGDGDGLVVGDAEAVELALHWRPRPHSRPNSRLVEPDGRFCASLVVVAVGWQLLLMGAPAYLRWLTALRDEAVNRPRIHELS